MSANRLAASNVRLWSPVPGGQSAITFPPSHSQPAFRHVHHGTGDPAAARRFACHPPMTSTDCPAASNGGGEGWRFPSMPSRGLSATALTQWRSPCRSASFQAHHCLLCRSNDGAPATASKRYVLGRNRESRSRPGNCDFPGISIPNYHINNNSTFQQL